MSDASVSNTPAPTDDVPAPMTFAELIRGVRDDFRRSFAALVGFETIFKLAVVFLLLPGMAVLLFALIRWSGRTALTTEDILSFILSPWGVLYGFLLGIKVLGITLLEHAGVMAVVALKRSGHWHGFKHAMTALASRILLVLRLTALILGIAVVGLAPFAGLTALTYVLLLGQQDINYYLADRPPRFYVAAGIGVSLLLGALALAAFLYVRWVFALCIVLLEGEKPILALKLSAARTRGIRWRVAAVLLGWQVIGLVVQLLLLGAFHLLAGAFLAGASHSPRIILPTVIVLLALHGMVVAAVSAFVIVIHCLLILRMYVHRGLLLGLLQAEHWGDNLEAVTENQPRRVLPRLEWGVAGVVMVGAIALVTLTASVNLQDRVEIHAHRGYSTIAPENTLVAIQKAIDAGADWAEIDVQETADGEVVVMHDRDLARMTGDRRRVRDVRLSDLKKLRFLPRYAREFKDERIPTLREVIELCKDRIKVNIELKFYGKQYGLAKKVVDLISEYDFGEECLIASLDNHGLREVKKLNSDLKTAIILPPTAGGDIVRLDVDYLEIHKELATDKLLRKAHRLGKKVFVWTVDDRREMRRFLDRGVDSIITNNPAMLVELRKERNELGDSERLLLAYRHLLD
jgi:glycerophosphoryl diester phosphodiesterase